MATLRVSTLLASLALVLALALPSSALGAAKGIESEITWGVSSTVQSQDATAMRDLGASWTRITLNWHDGEPSKGSYSTSYLGSVDRAVSLARSNGISVLMVVYGSPSWASGVSDPDAPPRNNQDYVNFLHAMVQRYAGQVPAWEVWNEENLGRFWGQQPNPGAYGNMLKLSYPAVKSADPNAKVVFGGMSGNDWDYLNSVYRDTPDIGSYYDVMAVHPYSPIWAPDNVRYDGTGHIARDSFPGYREVHRVMLEHGNDKPMYITEFGWATTSEPGLGVSPENQAAWTKMAYQCLNQDPYVQVAIIYELRNNWWAGDADDWEDQLGLVNTNWSHKPAYDAFKSIDPNQGGCSYGVDPASPTSPAPGAGSGASGSPTKAGAGSTQTKTAGSSRHRVIVRVREVRKGAAHSARRSKRHALKVTGSVVGASGGRVQLRFERKAADGRWRRSLSVRVGVDGAGHFKRALATRSLGRWRVRAVYQDPQRPAQSRFAYFRL